MSRAISLMGTLVYGAPIAIFVWTGWLWLVPLIIMNAVGLVILARPNRKTLVELFIDVAWEMASVRAAR